MAQLVVPIADNSDSGNWDSSPIWSHIDVPGGGDSVQTSADTGFGAFVDVQLGPIQCPQAGTYTLTVQFGTASSTGIHFPGEINIRTTLYGNGADVIVQRYHTALTDISYTLNADEINKLVGTCNVDQGNNVLTNLNLIIEFAISNGTGLPCFAFTTSPDIDASDKLTATIYYAGLSVPDAFTPSVTPACSATTGGSTVTVSNRGLGAFINKNAEAVTPGYELAFINDDGGEFVDATDIVVVDDDTVTCTVPNVGGSAEFVGQLFFFTNYPAEACGSEAGWSWYLDKQPSAFVDPIWTWSNNCPAVGPTLEMDETEAVAALLVGNVGATDDNSFVFNGLVLDANDDTGDAALAALAAHDFVTFATLAANTPIAALKIGGQTEFEFFSPSTPTAQNGGSWRLHSFIFKYRQEEIS